MRNTDPAGRKYTRRRRIGIIVLIIGVVAMAAALFFYFRVGKKAEANAAISKKVLETLEEIIPGAANSSESAAEAAGNTEDTGASGTAGNLESEGQAAGSDFSSSRDLDSADGFDMRWDTGDPPTLSVYGFSCIGILKINGKNGATSLPVVRMDSGSLAADPYHLPCLISGNPSEGLVLEGPGFDTLRNILKKAVHGDTVTFIDVYGVSTSYIVETSGYIAKQPEQVPGGLVLYCRTFFGYTEVSCGALTSK